MMTQAVAVWFCTGGGGSEFISTALLSLLASHPRRIHITKAHSTT